MTTENLYWVLSPDAYTDLRESLKRQAEQERREAVARFGVAGWRRLLAHARHPSRQRPTTNAQEV